jgi:hypothetical protein
MESEGNRVRVYRRGEDIEDISYNDLDVDLSLWQKILIIFLNLMAGGLGTMLEYFLNKKKKKCRLILAGILLGLLQIFHIVHFFSLFKEIELIEKFYDYISDDTFLLLFFDDDDNKEDKDKSFLEQLTTINISKIIGKNERKKFF